MKLVRISMPPGDWVGGAPKAYFSDEPYPQIELEKTCQIILIKALVMHIMHL